MPNKFHFSAIGVLHCGFKEKFGVPRQSGLAKAAKACIELLPPYDVPEALNDLQEVSHVWLVFAFHLNHRTPWRPKVRPPRLGGNKSLGVFATRSPFRPNPLGLSAVEVLGVEGSRLWVAGVDMVDGTPILDIKPYVPYTDVISHAKNGIAPAAPEPYEVVFSDAAEAYCQTAQPPELKTLITQVLSLDPRPQYHALNNERVYGVSLFDKNIRWKFQDATQIVVLHIDAQA